MALFDLPLEELQSYRPDVSEPGDFDDFWQRTLDEARRHDLNLRLEPIDARATLHDTYDVTFAGFGGQDVKAWLFVPADHDNVPVVVQYHGYSGGRGMPFPGEYVNAGYAHLVLDTRGQGWSTASIFEGTPDSSEYAGGNVPGVMTTGLDDPDRYYYRRLYVDVVRLLEVAQQVPQIDPDLVFVAGGSQGGAMTIAAAGLAPMAGITLAGALPDVPFLCHFERALTLTDSRPYKEIGEYFCTRPRDIEQSMRTLSYFDGVNLARRATCPTLFSVALMDQVCPPSTVYAAYNQWGQKADTAPESAINVYPYNGHEGGQQIQRWEQLGWLRDRVQLQAKPAKAPRRGRRSAS
ncbi:acetylxylan esterase [Aestuariimicrobium sp. T2.26MG-19.2B]|uniref:acetylxylan esterase n=1 Tax=Aestuariimicrobium sp. T2.26MG-19.2B TaxID=3040679 RepID=UPI0024776671|nr:acetylxylan esterase [Aestuariimicrobium sp. T2.26MG-19.2B]CAI9404905.1 Cephalosporin-C deacetylase [Aestuariimicrobium sp. T2.26MG-19.2B]